MNLRQFKDDGGKTVAWRAYRNDTERQQAVRELLPLADGKEIRWHETPVLDNGDPLPQAGHVGFVALEDQTELLASARVRLNGVAACATSALEFYEVAESIAADVLPCNVPEFVDIVAAARKVMDARFPGPVGRVLLKFGTSAIAYDFDSLKVDANGLEFSCKGVVTRHNAEDLAGADYVMITPRKEK